MDVLGMQPEWRFRCPTTEKVHIQSTHDADRRNTRKKLGLNNEKVNL
jgi:hypothetical protein